jgi:hypothetical protein
MPADSGGARTPPAKQPITVGQLVLPADVALPLAWLLSVPA